MIGLLKKTIIIVRFAVNWRTILVIANEVKRNFEMHYFCLFAESVESVGGP